MTKNKNGFMGRHLIIDAVTTSQKNLTSQDSTFRLLEELAKSLEMTLVVPPIVVQFPFAARELSNFTEDVSIQFNKRLKEAKKEHPSLDINLDILDIMKKHLSKRMEGDAGVSGVSVWAESHATIHTWNEDNYFSFDAFSCKDYNVKKAILELFKFYEIKNLYCTNMLRYRNRGTKISRFEVNSNQVVVAEGKELGSLESFNMTMWESLMTY